MISESVSRGKSADMIQRNVHESHNNATTQVKFVLEPGDKYENSSFTFTEVSLAPFGKDL